MKIYENEKSKLSEMEFFILLHEIPPRYTSGAGVGSGDGCVGQGGPRAHLVVV